MRRGPSRIGPTSRRRKRRSQASALADRLRSAPPLAKLAAASVVGLGLYVLFSLGIGATGRRSGAIDGRVDLGVGKDGRVPGGGGAVTGGRGGEGKKEWGLRRTLRQLNMIGFESEGGEGGEWKTCRAFEEAKLAPHKKPGQAGHDPFLRQVKPTPGAKWELVMSEDQDAEWLGLHQWDDRYTHGSEEADRRVKKLGYCRVHMPSVPRTGSTWFRAMFEAATGQPSFSMWQEGGTFKEKYKAFSSDDPCGASLDHMEGRLTSKKVFPCRDMKPPNATSPILYKSHTPFFPSYNKPSLMPSETCMLLLLVRNPIDNQDAWTRYMAGKSQPLREYLPVWQGHLSHWIASAGDIPIYVFRYEDMLYRAEDVLRRILQTLPGGWVWSEESIAKAMRMHGPQKPFETKCGSGLRKCSVAEVNMVREHYGNYMRHLGYRFVKK